jgi:two-component system phosphate regulon sensor histidine kinase PhoR
VYNLVENAIKYNKEDGLIQVSLLKSINGPILEVKDTGIGIPAEDRARIFERFYRADKSHSKEISGTGLGLSIVKHSAAYLGAKVEVESEVGKGTTMRVVF